MIRTAIVLACLAPLAACSQEPEVSAQNASVEEVANEVAAAGGGASFVRAGQWESNVTIEEVSMPGMPPEMASRMKDSFQGRMQSHKSCLTEEQAKRPKEEFFAGTNKNCRYDHFTMGDGEIDAAMRCSEGGATQVMTMQGSYSPDTYQMEMSMKADAEGAPGGGMTMRMRVDAKRTGDCDGTEKA